MLLRLRIRLPDRPGSLGQVARTLGVLGADIVAVLVLERAAGRAVDDITVIWPNGAPPARVEEAVAAIPGVVLEGLWACVGNTGTGSDAELIGQVAANPAEGLATLVDAAPGLLHADWAAALALPADWADRGAVRPVVVYQSWRAPQAPILPEVTPVRTRAVDAPHGRYASVPLGRAGLVLLVARDAGPTVPGFHVSELDRLSQVVRAVGIVLGAGLDRWSEAASPLAAPDPNGTPSLLPGPVGG